MTDSDFFFTLRDLVLRRAHGSAMLKGFNSDIPYRGSTYHVQTEDWGKSNPFIVSHIFLSGAVIKSIKIPYTKVLPRGEKSDAREIHVALETQHQSILDLLVSGQLF